jgi:deoxycytidine triphosphate deaminase
MGLKPDHWIRKMALEQGMIEPFIDRQVRQGVISYGVSSYGYDVRVTDEFKIFTNVFSAVVDPKEFDRRSMVDYKGDICIIPPNSFALARTVEYFRIPRKVLTVCLGKSTYARCFRGDTRVALIDGSAPTLEEMARRAEDGAEFWGYSLDKTDQIIVSLLKAPRYIGRDSLLEVELDNGEKIHCTPDHKFMTRDGQMIEAGHLRPGASLMPLYRQTVQQDERIYQPVSRRVSSARQMAQNWALRQPDQTDLSAVRRPENPWIAPPVNANPNFHTYSGQPINHRVTSIRSVAGDHDVYCLTVPETGNFALEAGIFVSNCGLIVNVTPFEPEWEGYVTLEISNTTPLPARVYANEGIAQVLFFEADEECEVSYADKKGKYQYQQEIILPKI